MDWPGFVAFGCLGGVGVVWGVGLFWRLSPWSSSVRSVLLAHGPNLAKQGHPYLQAENQGAVGVVGCGGGVVCFGCWVGCSLVLGCLSGLWFSAVALVLQ